LPEGPAPSRLILASASPRRSEILGALGIPFEVMPSGVEELSGGDPPQEVPANALRKARAVIDRVPGECAVLGADTEVVIDGRALGKAKDEADARERLRVLAGRTHEVITALALIERDAAGDLSERTAGATSRVTFRKRDDALIDLYLGSGEWRDKSGSYAIQGLGSMLIERVDGDISNVVGLPVPTLLDLLQK
jgi:septum formation protein